METELIRSLARDLRYRPLGPLVGRVVEVHDLETVEEAVRAALGDDFPAACRLVGPGVKERGGAVAKYGILDLTFSAPAELLAEGRTGVGLLRELGYLPGGEVGPQHRVCDDPTCLEMLQEDLAEGRAYLKLLLEGGRPQDGAPVRVSDGPFSFRIPEGYFPRPFRIRDACVTNAPGVWLWKHFYL